MSRKFFKYIKCYIFYVFLNYFFFLKPVLIFFNLIHLNICIQTPVCLLSNTDLIDCNKDTYPSHMGRHINTNKSTNTYTHTQEYIFFHIYTDRKQFLFLQLDIVNLKNIMHLHYYRCIFLTFC